jgi:hypothetical protein
MRGPFCSRAGVVGKDSVADVALLFSWRIDPVIHTYCTNSLPRGVYTPLSVTRGQRDADDTLRQRVQRAAKAGWDGMTGDGLSHTVVGAII